MSELRERFRALDALDVPDVMSRARTMGPIPPEPDRTPPMRRVGALVLAAVIAIAAAVLIIRALDMPRRPANPAPTPTETAFRRDGEVVTYAEGHLVAVDPDTGAVRTLVAAQSRAIDSAAWSADGRWVAFEVRECDDGPPSGGLSPGLWVMNGPGEPRQLTTRPCSPDPDVYIDKEHWEWSPAGAQLVIARRGDGDTLVLIDPATGDRTDLGEAAGDVTSLAWSPDGTQIAYAAVPTGTLDEVPGTRGSLYAVGVGGGVHSLLASSLGYVTGGEAGAGIRWSPDGARIAVTAEAYESGQYLDTRLYLMNSDGSDLDLLTERVVIEHVLGSPNLEWSPDGTRIAYATFSGDRGSPDLLQLWNASPDGSTPVLVFESTPASERGIGSVGGPVWSPDGTRIAFRHSWSGKAWLVANADGTGPAREIDELQYLSWRGGWYFCECYG